MTVKLHKRLVTCAITNADEMALSIGDQFWSYGELFGAAAALAAALAKLPEGAVGIFGQRSYESYVGVLAAVLSGRAYVPLNPKFPVDRLNAILGICRPAALIVDNARTGKTGDLDLGDAAQFDAAAINQLGAAPLANGNGPNGAVPDDQTAYFMFTSGTTGTPKGVQVLCANVEQYLDGIAPITQIRPGDRCTQLFDLSFDLSVHDIFVTLTGGGTLYVMDERDSLDPVAFVIANKIDCWFSVPSVATFARKIGRLLPGAMPSLRISLFCGEPLPVSIARDWATAAPDSKVWNLYGPTEATIAITAFEHQAQIDYTDAACLPLGIPLLSQSVRIADGAKLGEFELGGSQVTPGYINNPAAQAEKFYTEQGINWYRTGDLVEAHDRLGYVFRGRIDEQVKIGGYRVELLEIEEVLRSISGTSQVAAIPWPVAEDGLAEGIVAFTSGAKATDRDMIKAARSKLPSYMVPRKIHAVAEIPLNVNGKIDRKKLAEQLAAGASV